MKLCSNYHSGIFGWTAAVLIWSASTAFLLADPPATAPSEPPLPAGAVRRFGDLRFLDSGLRGECFSTDNQRLLTYGSDLISWDVHSGWAVSRVHVSDLFSLGAASFGPNQLAIALYQSPQAQEVCIVDSNSGKVLRRFDQSGHFGITDFSAAPDGSRFVVTTDHILLCDGQTGQTIHDLGVRPGTGTVGLFMANRLQFSSDSHTLLAVLFDAQAHLIDPATGKDKINRTFAASLGTTISADGSVLATISQDGKLHLFDLPGGNELPMPAIPALPAGDQPFRRPFVRRAAFAAKDGMLAFWLVNRGLYILDTRDRPLKAARKIKDTTNVVIPIVFSPDGSLLAVSDGAGRQTVISTQTGQSTAPASVNMQRVNAMAVSPDGRELMAGNGQGELFRWDLQDGTLLAHRDPSSVTDFVRGPVERLSYFDECKSILLQGTTDVRICDAKTLKTQTQLFERQPGQMFIRNMPIYSPDGRWCVINGQDLNLVERTTNTTTLLLHQDEFRPLVAMAISPDATLLYANCSEGPRIVDLLSHQVGPVIELNNTTVVGMSHARFSPNSKWFSIQISNITALYDARELLKLPIQTDFGQIAIGNRLVPRAPISSVSPIWTHNAGDHADSDVAFSPCSELLASFGAPKTGVYQTLSICEVRTGRSLLTFPDFSPAATTIAFVPGKPMLLTGDSVGTVLLWDLRKLMIYPQESVNQQKKSDDELWSALSGPDPISAYRAGLTLIDRRHLVDRAASLAPLTQTDVRKGSNEIQSLITALSSKVSADREKAHKALEGKGPAAIAQVRVALDAHPGGELEDRLNDIAHVIGADDPSTPVPAPTVTTASDANPQDLQTARVIQLLEWSDDPKATEQRKRLTGSTAAK